MANELQVTMAARLRNGELVESFTPNAKQASQSASLTAGKVQIVGTTKESLDFGDVSTAGYAGFSNLDGTNFVQVGIDSSGTFVSFATLLAGESALLPLTPGATYQAKFDTLAGKLKYWVASR